MYVALKCVIVDADADSAQKLDVLLTEHGVNVAGSLQSVEALGPILDRSDAPQLVIVNLDPSPRDTLRAVGQLVRRYATVNFFVASRSADPSLLMEAIHLGVREFLPLPMDREKLLAGIERIACIGRAEQKAQVIHVIPTIGGCGATTVACNLAAKLAESSRTVLVDLDLAQGMVASAFDVRPRYTLADVMLSPDKIDQQLVENALTVHQPTRLSILARPELPEEAMRITQAGMSALLAVLSRMFDTVVIDSVMCLDPMYATVIRSANTNLVVVQLNIPSVRNAERLMAALRRMGIEASKICVVINRQQKRGSEIDPREVERILGQKIAWTIPNDYKSAMDAMNFGDPVVRWAPRSALSESLRGLPGIINTHAAVEI